MTTEWLETLNSTIVNNYTNQLFQGISSPDQIFLFLLVCLIIGFLVITLRYAVNPRNITEYKKWKDENTLTKIILSFLVGLFGCSSVEAIIEFISILSLLISGAPIKHTLDLGFISFAIVYTYCFVFILGIKTKETYKDLQKFIITSFKLTFILVILILSVMVIKSNWVLGILFFLCNILFFGTIYYFVKKAMNNKKGDKNV